MSSSQVTQNHYDRSFSLRLLDIRLNAITANPDPHTVLRTLKYIGNNYITTPIAPEMRKHAEKIQKMICFPEKYCENPRQYNDFKAKVLALVDEKIKHFDSLIKSTPPATSTFEPNKASIAYYKYLSERVANLEAWAQYEMGCKYHTVDDDMVKYSPEMAVIFYQLAAEQNFPEAQYKLAQCLQTGDGIESDFDASIKWLFSAASLGHLSAQYDFGLHLIRTNPANLAQGCGWIQRAAKSGLPAAQFTIGVFYDSDIGIHLLGDIAQEEAINWFWNAAEQGDMHAQFKLGNYYEYGLGGLEKNLTEAINWYITSANQGNETAKWYLNNLLAMMSP